MNPLLLPVAGGLAILLLLLLLVLMRRRARRAGAEGSDPGGEPEDDAHEDDAVGEAELDAVRFHDGELAEAQARDGFDDGTDLVPMIAHDDQSYGDTDAHADADADGRTVEDEPAEAWREPDETVHTPEPLPRGESVDVRYLRAQVRTLQETLEQVQDTPDPVAARAGEATFRRQVTAALRGLGERTREDESPERTLARVVAAIERLDAPDEVARPALPTVKFDLSGAQMSLAGPFAAAPAALGQAPAAPAPAPAAPGFETPLPEDPAPAPSAPAPASMPEAPQAAPVPAATGPAMVTTPLASALAAGSADGHPSPGGSQPDPFAQDEQVLPAPADPDVVRPVPPPASHRQERPRRFSRRRGA